MGHPVSGQTQANDINPVLSRVRVKHSGVDGVLVNRGRAESSMLKIRPESFLR
jgi:hypothetical protein